MARAESAEIVDRFIEFYRSYYRDAIGELAQNYPTDQRSLYIDWADLYTFDQDLAEDVRAQPDQLRGYAEEALRTYDLPVDVSLGQAHVRITGLSEVTEIRALRAHHRGRLIAVQGIVRKATDVRPKVEEAAFECQRCGTLTRIPQSGGDFQDPHECQGCERQGPFRINFDQSEFVDAQKLRVQESPEGLRGGETPQSIDVHIEDDVTGLVTAGDHVRVTGVLHLDQQGTQQTKSPIFDVHLDGLAIEVEDEQFEEMDITDEDKREIVELSEEPDIYERMVDSMAPSIYGYDEQKLAIILQLFSGVRKDLPDGSRIRGDLHMLLVGDPGTGKCLNGNAKVTLADGTERAIGDLVEENLEDPKPVDDGMYDEVDFGVISMGRDGSVGPARAIRVWKREAPDRMFALRTDQGRTLRMTPSHPLFVASDQGIDGKPAVELEVGDRLLVPQVRTVVGAEPLMADGGTARAVGCDRITSIETVQAEDSWVYDLEVEGTHAYLANGLLSHNSQLLQYVRNLAPRSVYTSGKGTTTAGLTAAAVRSDFGDGDQWTLEAGALVLADKGIAAVDELDKMSNEDQSALHQALEQQEISISKAGINATLKSRCSLLGAANPTYGRFDHYEPIGEQIDLEPALISRFDLIFTVTDQPDAEEDRALADHIIGTNYAGELNAHRRRNTAPNVSEQAVKDATRNVEPAIDPEFLRKYVAYAKRTCYPTMTEAARDTIGDFYVELRAQGQGEESPVPVTARKLEALVRLAEASARIRLSDTVEQEDADRVIDIVRSSLEDVGMDPETGEFDADVIEAGTSKSQRDRIKTVMALIEDLVQEYSDEPGAPIEALTERAGEAGIEADQVEHRIEDLKKRGEVYEPRNGYVRST